MPVALAIFAAVIVAASAFTMVFPAEMLAFAAGFMTDPAGIWWAAAMRLLLAVLLWFSAPVARTPTVFRVLAVFALAAAVAIPVMGSERLIHLVDWFAAQSLWTVWAIAGLGVAFGGFILWSVSNNWATE